MTQNRRDTGSTEFGLWLRNEQPYKKCVLCGNSVAHKGITGVRRHVDDPISSNMGFVTSNIDYIWTNYKNNQWMLIEEKRYNAPMSFSQSELFMTLHRSICNSDYRGFFFIQFEKTNPEDGDIFITNMDTENKVQVTKEQLLDFLQFNFKV